MTYDVGTSVEQEREQWRQQKARYVQEIQTVRLEKVRRLEAEIESLKEELMGIKDEIPMPEFGSMWTSNGRKYIVAIADRENLYIRLDTVPGSLGIGVREFYETFERCEYDKDFADTIKERERNAD
jgi:hypothetical protein